MMLRSALALLALAGTTAAQTIDVTSSDRDLSVFCYGYDYEFDDGAGASDATAAPGPWTRSFDVDLEDYYGNYVSNGQAASDTDVGPTRIGGLLQASGAVPSSPLFSSDGGGTAKVDVDFDLHQKVRYTLAVDLATEPGYTIGEFRLQGAAGSLHSLFDYDGSDGVIDAAGWLVPGSYTLLADLESWTGSVSYGESEATSGSIDFELRVARAVDFDMDGDVDVADRDAYRSAWFRGGAAADYDVDGDVDGQDWIAFRRDWLSSPIDRTR